MILYLTGIAVAILMVAMQLVLLYKIVHGLNCAKKDALDILDNIKKVSHTHQG